MYSIARISLLTLTLVGFAAPQVVNAYPALERACQQQAHLNTLRRPPSDVKAERLGQSVDLPNIPTYPGKAVFLQGYRVYDHNGEQIGMIFEANETVDQVIQWYQDSLKEYSWNLLKNQEPNVISALKDGNTFAIRIVPAHTLGYRSRLLLSFQYGR